MRSQKEWKMSQRTRLKYSAEEKAAPSDREARPVLAPKRLARSTHGTRRDAPIGDGRRGKRRWRRRESPVNRAFELLQEVANVVQAESGA
jgi:hypothetical protein